MNWLGELQAGFIALLWPEADACPWCGGPLEPLEEQNEPVLSGLCSSCREAVQRGPVRAPARPPLQAVVAAGAYEGGLAQAIQALKYRHRRRLAATLGEALAAAARTALVEAGVLVPVPLHPTRYRGRGFNQSELLGRELSRRLGWPLEARSLRRVRPTKSQAKLGLQEREANLFGAFAARPGWQAPERVILVDDVYTTGATTSACAAALLAAGAKRVDVLALAVDL